jgi:fucose permease
MIASVLGMIMFGAVQVVPPVCLDAIANSLGLTHEQCGRLIAVRMAALTLCLLVVGRFGDRRGKHHLLFWGLAVITLGQVLGARALGFGVLLVSMLVSGLGYGVFEALINPLIAQLHPRNSARALNIINGIFSVGLVIGALSAGELLQAGYSWRLPMWLWAVPPLVCAVLYLTPRYPPPSHEGQGPELGPGMTHFFKSPLFWVLVVSMILGGGCEAGLTSWAPKYVSEVLHASARGGAWTTILYGTFMAIGRFGTGYLLARISPIRLMFFSALLCGIVTAALAFVPVLWGAYVLFALGGLFVACFWPTLLSVASDRIAVGSTSLFSLLAAAGVTGCVLVPWTIGALGDVLGLRMAVLVLPATMVLLAILLTVIPRLRHHRQHPAA